MQKEFGIVYFARQHFKNAWDNAHVSKRSFSVPFRMRPCLQPLCPSARIPYQTPVFGFALGFGLIKTKSNSKKPKLNSNQTERYLVWFDWF
jgi:hypothetical protein